MSLFQLKICERVAIQTVEGKSKVFSFSLAEMGYKMVGSRSTFYKWNNNLQNRMMMGFKVNSYLQPASIQQATWLRGENSVMRCFSKKLKVELCLAYCLQKLLNRKNNSLLNFKWLSLVCFCFCFFFTFSVSSTSSQLTLPYLI